MSGFSRWIGVAAVLLSAMWLGIKAVPPTDDAAAMKVHEFGRLPVVYQGRVKPFDTLARNSLLIISDKQSFKDQEGTTRPAIDWLLDVISNCESASAHQIFRIENLELLDALGLERRKGFRYALQEFAGKRDFIDDQARRAGRRLVAEREVYDNKVLEFAAQVHLYDRLVVSHELPAISSKEELDSVIGRYSRLMRFSLPHSVPPSSPNDDWKPLMRAALESTVLGEHRPAVHSMGVMFEARRNGDAQAFNKELDAYRSWLAEHAPPDTARLGFEVFFNHLEPFYHCSVLYVFGFLLSIFAWLGWSEPLNRGAFWLIGFTFVVHTFGLVARIYISGYPPVTTLYSSAIFIGWGAVVLGLILEKLYHLGVGNTIGSISGFVTLLIAHFLSGDGDTFEMMQAVLDTKFWLATHVTTVTLGYTATFVAGGLAVLFIFRGVLTKSFSKELEQSFARMIYGIICFATLLSFVGMVLGGLWADDSWGRFWGWDPKENGALIIVLWNVLVLHARWGGMVKARGIAVLAVFGSVVTSCSWFGVNQLGVGLHSYGFTDSVAFWLVLFVLTQLGIMALGMLPRHRWRSYHGPW